MKSKILPAFSGRLYCSSEIDAICVDFLQKNSRGILEILGPTASGKTDYTVSLTKKISHCFPRKKAEVIVVDSRQVFIGCDIASAKISPSETEDVPHWGMDLVAPEKKISIYDFQRYAYQKIEEIFSRGNIPILSGGTMLWLDAISENYHFSEKGIKSNKKNKPLFPVLKIGLHWHRKALYERINERSVWQFENGLIEETKKILDHHTLSASAITSFGYREIADFLAKKISRETALEINQKRNRNYAKRQITWWRNHSDIFWLDCPG